MELLRASLTYRKIMAHKIIGTAGHIDHGKSSLVRALTGTDPDRLAEEQERGMTIDLGFAFLNENIAFIDVPGHEKFIKNMVAGVSTIDLALLVIAADDGVMPQTREHLDILKLLRLQHGVIALTKIDMVDEEWLKVVEEDIRQWICGSFLEKAPILRVSSVTNEGVEHLRQTLIDLAEKAPSRQDRGLFWMPVDRSFTIKGHGTIVTGSVLSGQVRVGDTLELLPAKRSVRVRGIQSHGVSSPEARIGERAALNLMNIAKEEVQRGDILAAVGLVKPSSQFDVRLSLLPKAPRPLTSRMRIRVHIGTGEIMARVKLLDREKLMPGQTGLAQLHLEETTAALKRDPFIIRFYSPQFTIGGGIVLDANALPHRRSDRSVIEHLKRLEEHDPEEMVIAALAQPDKAPTKIADLSRETGIAADELKGILDLLISRQIILNFGQQFFIHRQNFSQLKEKIQSLLAVFHEKEPLRPGMKRANLSVQIKSAPPVLEAALLELVEEGIIHQTDDFLRLTDFSIQLTPHDQRLADEIVKIFNQAPFTTPPVKILAQMTRNSAEDVQRVINALLGMGKTVRLEEDIFLTSEAVQTARDKLAQFAESKSEIAVSEFRELLETSRKFALPLLMYFDEKGVTERFGEIRHILQQKSRS